MSEKQTGGISVNTENIFPVIKKWLYSEKDIFLRELVSNATDAITNLKRFHFNTILRVNAPHHTKTLND